MRLMIACALILAAGVAEASDWDTMPPDAVTCSDSADAAVTDCTIKAYEAADKELNAVWKQALATIVADPGNLSAEQAAEWKADLTAAQKAWAEFKDQDCNGARSFEYWGGSGRSLAVATCLYNYTVARTAALKARYLDR